MAPTNITLVVVESKAPSDIFAETATGNKGSKRGTGDDFHRGNADPGQNDHVGQWQFDA